MILLDDFVSINLGTIIVAIIGAVISFILYRNAKLSDDKLIAIAKDNDDKILALTISNKAEIDRINKHLENTDAEVEELKRSHNTLNIQIIERMNSIEKGITAQITTLSIQIEALRK